MQSKPEKDEEAFLRKHLLNAKVTSGLALLALLGVVLSIAFNLNNHAKASDLISVFINDDSSSKRASVVLEVLSPPNPPEEEPPEEEPQEGFDLSLPLVAVVFTVIALFSLFSVIWVYRRRH